MRIALASVGTLGDVMPFAVLGRALQAAGHDVRAISWELHRPEFEAAGLAFEPIGPVRSTDEIRRTAEAAASQRSPLRQVAVLRDFHLRDGETAHHQLREALRGQDLAIINAVHSLAQAAALDERVPWICARLDPALLPSRSYPPPGAPSLGPANAVLWRLVDLGMRPMDRSLDNILRRSGSSASGLKLFRGRSGLLELVACSPTLMRIPSDLPDHVHVTGAWTDDIAPSGPLPAEVEAFLSAGPPPVVVTFGSMASNATVALGATVAAAIRHNGMRAIVQRGAAGLTAPGGGGDLLSVDSLPHRALFPRAAAVVHHGGAGTTHAAVAAGVPSVVVPHMGDQPYWAARLAALRVAPAPLPLGRVTVAGLAGRLADALDASTRTQAARLGEQVRAERGVENAVERIAHLAFA